MHDEIAVLFRGPLGPLTFCVALAACAPDAERSPATQARTGTGALPPAGARATATLDAEDGQWSRPGKSYSLLRYSQLNEISTSNVSQLKQAWSYSTGVLRGHEEPPIVVNGTMYIVTPYPNELHALDVGRSGTPKWVYRPKPAAAAQGVACCDVVNRGPVYDNGRIFMSTLDNHVVAVDAASGREIWKTRVGDINKGETMTMAPLVVKGLVLVGNSGGEMGVRGWIKALDAASGSVRWTAYSTGPDRDVLIGARFKPFYEDHKAKDLGVQTWPGDTWTVGGGTVWGWISYDPELDLIFYGTANPGPWNPEQRPGDNKWTSTLFARDPDTGEAVWAYQKNPHDEYDYDGINEPILVDMPWQGQMRKVILHPGRNGYMYVFDRATGQVLSATPYGHITTSLGVDLNTGRLQPNKAKAPRLGVVVRDICPASPGTKDWQPSAFSPRTGLLYIPHQNLCQDVEALEANYIAGTPYVGMNVKMKAGPGGHRGEFTAWDPVAARPVWKLRERFPVWSGALVTAGDVVFFGTMDGWFRAVDARTGQLLWQHQLGSGIISQPTTFRAPDGNQYVAVVAGVGGWSGAIVAGGLDPRDSTAALGFAAAMSDLPQYTAKGGTVHVFALP